MAKLELSYTRVGNVKYAAAMENSLAVLQKTKQRELPHDPAIPLLVMYSREMKTCIYTKLVHGSS